MCNAMWMFSVVMASMSVVEYPKSCYFLSALFIDCAGDRKWGPCLGTSLNEFEKDMQPNIGRIKFI